MQKYDDIQNKNGMRVLFMVMQICILLIVYSIIYTSLIAVQYTIKEQGISAIAYVPVLVSLILFPVLLYSYRQMFNRGKMLKASIWTLASSSMIIIVLYLYIDTLVG